MSIISQQTREVSIVETKSFVIRIPSFIIPIQTLKLAGIFLLACLIVFVTSSSTTSIEQRPSISISKAEVIPDGILSKIEKALPFNDVSQVDQTEPPKETDLSIQIRARAIELLKEKWNPQSRTFKKRGGGFSSQNNTVTISKKEMMCYVPDFIVEEVITGVPCLSSVTTAQADIEGNWWSSNLAKKTNNNFGIKDVKKWDKDPETWLGQYRDGHVIAHDDIPTDKFIKFKSKWACIRFHTKFLTLLHYKKHIGKDFNGWAKGLKESGYATDKTYPQTLKDRYNRLDLKTVESIAYQLRQEFK